MRGDLKPLVTLERVCLRRTHTHVDTNVLFVYVSATMRLRVRDGHQIPATIG